MSSALRNIRIVHGKYFSVIWRFENIDLRDCQFQMNWRSEPPASELPEFTVQVLEGQSSTVTRILVSLTEIQTGTLDESLRYYYDLDVGAPQMMSPMIHGEALVERFGE